MYACGVYVLCAYLYIYKNTGVRASVCTKWRRHIGCLNLQVIFRNRATNYRALFRR